MLQWMPVMLQWMSVMLQWMSVILQCVCDASGCLCFSLRRAPVHVGAQPREAVRPAQLGGRLRRWRAHLCPGDRAGPVRKEHVGQRPGGGRQHGKSTQTAQLMSSLTVPV